MRYLTISGGAYAASLRPGQQREVLAEAVQTVMRRYGIEQPHEKFKVLMRGQTITAASIRSFIDSLDLPNEAKQQLLGLTPSSYTGNAAEQTSKI